MRQWYKRTDAAGKQLRADGMAEATLAELKPMWDEPFTTQEEFVAKIALQGK